MDIEVFGFSHQGTKRRENQDSIAWQKTVFTLADGMGGKPNGQKAAQFSTEMATKCCNRVLAENPDPSTLADIFSQIHGQVVDRFPAAGTTLAVVMVQESAIHCAHVGDSRIYALQNGNWAQIGQDQNLTAKTGLSINSGVLTNWIGKDGYQKPKICTIELAQCEMVLLCSDGFYKAIDITKSNPSDSADYTSKLEQSAHAAKPDDDYSALLVEFKKSQ